MLIWGQNEDLSLETAFQIVLELLSSDEGGQYTHVILGRGHCSQVHILAGRLLLVTRRLFLGHEKQMSPLMTLCFCRYDKMQETGF